MTRCLALALLFVLALLRPAAAADCTATISDIDFGTVSLRAGAVNQTTGSVTVECRGGLLGGVVDPVGVCLTFGGGSASDGGSPPRRYMTGADGSLLEYQLRPRANGSAGGTLGTLFLSVPVLAGRGSTTVPIYADILARSPALPTGPYAASFSGANGVTMKAGVVSCDLLATEQPVAGFAVRADVASSCEVTTGALDFGTIGAALGAPVDASAAIDVRCTSGTPYRVTLGAGTGPAVTGPAARQMRNLGATLRYGLFLDPARSQPWGESLGESRAGTGSGAAQRYTVFGRIFGNQQAEVGVYSDAVVVTIAY